MKKILVQGRDQFKSKHRTKNGELRDIENTVQMIELQGKMFYQVLTRDVTESEQAKAALVKSERGYRQLIETAQEGVWALDTNYVTVLANPRMAEMLGCTQTEMLGKSLFEFLDKQRSEEVKNFLKNHKDGFSGHHEYGLVRKDGTCLYGSISFSPIKNEAEECIGCLALVADNTERKKLEDELRDSEEKFRVMSTFASDAILLIDETDEIIYWNLAAERIFGYTKEEAVGKKLGQLVISPECRQKHCESVEKIMKHERLFPKTRMERKCLKKDGTELQIELSASAVNLKDKPCLLGLVRDVTERAKLEAALKQEREMLEKMAANIGAGLTIISKDYRILWANQLLKQVHKGPIENKHCYTIYDKNGKICPDCGAKKVFENGVDVDRHDYFFKDAQGKDSWVELIVTPVKDEDGNVVSALELAIGINERKQMQTKLAQYSQRLAELVEERTEQLKQTQAKLVKSERLAAIGELAGMVGHDLRNPLTSIKAASYFINARYSQLLDATGNDMLATIEKSINYSNKIINDLLDYSRDIKLEAVETTPKAMLKTALSLIELPPNTKIVDLTEDAPQMKTDMAKMSRVFVNIIKNASDAMPNGGTLTITSKTTDTHIEIIFADTGTGMSRATLRKLWTPLFTTKAKGMGFGLPICKRIVETHGGRILVDSKLGKGTVFTISLPKMLPPKAEADEEWIFVPPQPATALNQAKKAK